MDGASRLARQLHPGGRRHDRRQPPRDDVRRLRRLQADGGDGVGGRTLGFGRRRRAFPSPDRDHRARAGGRRLPQHRVRARRAAAALQRPRVGPRAVQRRPPLPGGRRPGAHHRADEFVEIARRVADHVCDTFADGGIERVCGHPEVELGLVELARVTGEQRYLDQAARFVERRGRGTLGEIQFGPAYFQDDVPIRDATVFRGHAVRALYLAAGRRRRRRRDRRRRAARDRGRAVGEHDRPPDVPHRRDGLAPHRRGVRRRLRAPAGPGLLRDVRRGRLGDAGLAAAARHR